LLPALREFGRVLLGALVVVLIAVRRHFALDAFALLRVTTLH